MRQGFLITALLCSTVLAAHAETEEATTDQEAQITLTQPTITTEPSLVGPSTSTGFSFGYGAYNYSYEETSDGSFFMSIKSSDFGMNRVNFEYSGALSSASIYWTISYTFFSGDTDYKSQSTGELKNTENTGDDIFTKINHDLHLTDSLTLSPYYGLGYRVLEDDKSNLVTTTGHSGYYRKSEYSYIPLGMDLYFQVSNHLQLRAQGQWNSLIAARQHSFSDVVNNQHSGWGAYLSTAAVYQTASYDIALKAFYHHWRLDDSDIQVVQFDNQIATLVEPANESKESGLVLSFSLPL